MVVFSFVNLVIYVDSSEISDPFDRVRLRLLTAARDMVFEILMPFRHADVPNAFVDYNIDRRNTDVSLPHRLLH